MLIMGVQLKPELYRLIAEQLMEVRTECGRPTEELRVAQNTITNLLLTSKVSH